MAIEKVVRKTTLAERTMILIIGKVNPMSFAWPH
jgi:hypothetical protein